MSSFTRELITTPLKDGKRWVIRREFFYDVGFEGSGDRITVPVGFVTDLTSVPKIFWSLLPRWDKYGQAAVIHDYLYFSHEKDRKDSDKIFYEAMRVLGVDKWKAKLMYNSVRLFGNMSFRNSKAYILESTGKSITIPEFNLD
jgi:hypothetical protein